MQHQQHPIVAVVNGGRSINFDDQERDGWKLIAAACEQALMSCLDAHHPERAAFVEMWRDCRRAAGLPLEPVVSRTA